MKLFAIDTDQDPMSEAAFNAQTAERRKALTTLMGANDALLNEVAVTATHSEGAWTHNSDLMNRIQDWLRNQQTTEEQL